MHVLVLDYKNSRLSLPAVIQSAEIISDMAMTTKVFALLMVSVYVSEPVPVTFETVTIDTSVTMETNRILHEAICGFEIVLVWEFV